MIGNYRDVILFANSFRGDNSKSIVLRHAFTCRQVISLYLLREILYFQVYLGENDFLNNPTIFSIMEKFNIQENKSLNR